MELPIGTVVDGRYIVEAPLGRGGMGTVYRVRHRELGTQHALKVLHARGRTLPDRLRREGRLQGTLRHPGVVRVTDLVHVDDHPALVLEWVRGRSLAEHLAEDDLPRSDWDRIAIELLDAVAAAHDEGLVHRDLKPGNILLEPRDGTLHPKVTDFGLAKGLGSDEALTSMGATFGTPAYMAPEQFVDATAVDARADVFALGAVLHELVSGRPLRGRAPVPQTLVPDVPERWRRAIDAALSPDPNDRPTDARALLAHWQGEAAHPPVAALVAQPPTATVADHLAHCAACRVERQLYLGTFAAPAPRPRPGVAALLGGVATLAALSATLGGLGAIASIGIWYVPIVGLGVVGAWRLGILAHAERPGTLLGWFVMPHLALLVGAVGSAAGASIARRVLDRGPLLDVPRLAGQAATVSLDAWIAGQVVALGLLFGALVLSCVARRDPEGSFDGAPVGLALGGGAALWLVEEWLGNPSLPGVLVFGAVVVASLLLAAAPRRSTIDRARLRRSAFGAGSFGVCAVLLTRMVALGDQLGSLTEAPASDGVALAEAFAAAWGTVFTPFVGLWSALAIGVASIGARGSGRLTGREALHGVLLIALVAGPSALVARATWSVSGRIVPGWQAAALADRVAGLHLYEAPDGVKARHDAPLPLHPEDRIVAIGEALVTTLGEVVQVLDRADCDGCAVTLTVDRDRRLHTVRLEP